MQGTILLGVLDTFTRLLGLGDPLSDLTFALKLIVFLVIIGYVRTHVLNPTTQVILLGVLAYFVLFQNWLVLGGLALLYLIITTGLFGVVSDFFFFFQWTPQHQENETATRQHEFEEMRHREMEIRHAEEAHRAMHPPHRPSLLGRIFGRR